MNVFQKRSPYLEDFNYLIDLSFQMGATWEKDIEDYFPNGTKCMSWQDVKESHKLDDPHVVISHKDIYGLLILLGLNLIVASISFALEHFTKGHLT